ncbi:DNA cytosine methyltransferase [Fusibacter sp. JL216-2]|uniref:DNA cytosine methyltransferase n=1 Tax=Fusibacter sp. JL216-2 TaxID=3071453 RepID=UPI003D350116
MYNQKLKTIDLFAGAGGLSSGFLQTGAFEIKVAVEINKNARETYECNHNDVQMYDDIKKINYEKLENEFGRFDVVIGGPPCQGFSNANRQKNNLICSNNELVKEYIKAIEKLKPKAFLMENVKSFESEKHKFFQTHHSITELEKLEICPVTEEFMIGEYNRFSDALLEFVNNSEELDSYIMPESFLSILKTLLRYIDNDEKFRSKVKKEKSLTFKTDSEIDSIHRRYWNEEYRNCFIELYKAISADNGIDKEFLQKLLNDLVETQKVLYRINEIRKMNVVEGNKRCTEKKFIVELNTYNVYDYVKKKLRSLGYVIDAGVLNAADYGAPQLRRRLCIVGIRNDNKPDTEKLLPKPFLKKENYYNLNHAIADIENCFYETDVNKDYLVELKEKKNSNPLLEYLNDTNFVNNMVITDTRQIALQRFKALKPGENFHNLSEELRNNTYTKPERTQSSIYRRLVYTAPSPTVTNVRKSMWIHPTKDRAISIREAARIQTFKDSFVFKGDKNSQYQQVGNAVPPLLARSIAETILKLLNLSYGVPIKELL